MIIKVDGACRNNGKEEAIASIGVYFGEGDAQNISNVFRDVEPTNQKAELVAGIRALETVYVKVATTKPKWNEEEEIVIQSDSEYLVKGMNEWIVNWKKNSFKKSNGKPVANKEYYKRLDELVVILGLFGAKVRFEHIPRAQNKEADKLANDCLDQESKEVQRYPGIWVHSSSSDVMCNDRNLFTQYKVLEPLPLTSPYTQEKGCGYAIGVGNVTLQTVNDKGKVKVYNLNNVLHTPHLALNLLKPINTMTNEEFVHDTLNVLRLKGRPEGMYPAGTPVEKKPHLLCSTFSNGKQNILFPNKLWSLN
eukprot:TRINITY_DN3187_c0_g1_i1.p1 TRINITY_DN3187_c0_g1~~TRINITY_DN3187_c0_g1_i1.p1  ORF type:complete len:307 (-),score=102.22 TRINITY_DN3187_c0_g1_i1:50-970(-)